MTLQEFRESFQQTEKVRDISAQLVYDETKISLKGLEGSGRAIVADSVIQNHKGFHLFILSDKEEAAFFFSDLQNLNKNAQNIFFYPHSYKAPYQFEEIDNANVVSRAEVMDRVNRGNNSVIVTYPQALFEKVITKKQFAQNIMEIKRGVEYSIDFINELLIEHGFEKVDFVYEPGQFAVRGGIVDIFSFSNDEPYRVEFFGDEVESIRTFNPVNQLSIKSLTRFSVVPNIQKHKSEEKRETFLEFVPGKTVVWIKDYKSIKGTLDEEYKKAKEIYDNLPESAVTYSPPIDLYFEKNLFEEQIKDYRVIEFGTNDYFAGTSSVVEKTSETNLKVTFNQKVQPAFNKNFELLIKDLTEKKQARYENFIISSQNKQIERIYSIFEDLESSVSFITINIALSEGFIDNDLNYTCYTDHQIFERYHRFRLKEGYRKNQQALTLKEIYNLQKGDFVTHVDHGVGQFSGLELIDVNGKPQEAIRLVYKDNDVLYVSIHSLHRISKFTGKDGTQPKLNKIGSPVWNNAKNKTKAKVKEIAYDLIKLYAQRKAEKGFAFSPDNYLQNELEASFIYEDTPDQLKATVAVKEDMESESPMDRLVCGDVGFGKTEIAIRAAFKAVCDSKQVAVLVPTTILSLQHYKTFKKRLEGFPCKVDYVNRFRSQKQITQSLKDLKDGVTDIIIGTHKLVGKKTEFKDLGLIIIDEEQKFGVGTKDKLKLFKASVDTLTLTATPIPRTLQFSLMGARDLSTINTPPPNRQPVDTEIIGLNEEIIRDAVSYEVQRGGQVYFVHNRVQNIHEVAGMIQRLCPGVRIGIGHGQMDGKKLEQIMVGFMDGEYDVLVATTIIESGIDVSNANTIIINQAQNFGLSDLHQMRGRVGRSNKKAFCYLISPPMHLLPSDSRKRLEAVAQFSDLGSGFNIAMRDLDIRGAGNLLGGEQSGFISEIGFEMYQKILNEAIKELKEEEFKHLFVEDKSVDGQEFVEDCILETDLELLIPDTYVNQVAERLLLYQELDNVKNQEELDNYREGLRDRFGEIPEVVEELILSIHLRWMAKAIGFEKLVIKGGKMLGYFVAKQTSPYYQSSIFTQVLSFIQTNPADVKMNERNEKLRLIYSNVKSITKAIENLQRIGVALPKFQPSEPEEDEDFE
ncbi:transcription-repair coupling factor [Paracrocinitomix mangrovi]|uniref:transcription-repair coupling factor n=1 Tax=Paracrocinitomix mangrovi TaxID=2862509 RepID=UPI001C8E7824|nr:transcription-repair coupling factor [Paracrocinitomix mangrovi]UKN03702.1 transcription-repair coupling factor [Paracrocinitomix mangrovi]